MKSLFTTLAIVFITGLSFAQPIILSIDKYNSDELNVGDTLSVSLDVAKYPQKISGFQLYLTFDQNVLTYLETMEVNKLFKSTWRDNKTDNFYVGLFLDFTQQGFILDEDETICQLIFIYNGGQTDLIWGTIDEVKDGLKIKGQTAFINPQNEYFELTLMDGCVCTE